MGKPANCIFALLYLRQQLIKQAPRFFARALHAYLPQPTDSEQDCDKNVLHLFTPANRAHNERRLAAQCDYPIDAQEGVIICKFKATLNILLACAHVLQHVTPVQMSAFIDEVVKIKVPNNADAGWWARTTAITQNINALNSLYRLWQNENRADANRMGAINRIFTNWQHLSVDDALLLQSRFTELFRHVLGLLGPGRAFIQEFEIAMQIKPGTLLRLIGIAKNKSAALTDSFHQVKVVESLQAPTLQAATILVQMEAGEYFKKSSEQAAQSGLKTLKARLTQCHQAIDAQLKKQFTPAVAARYRVCDTSGMYLPHREDTPASAEFKAFLNTLVKCISLLGQVEASRSPTFALLRCFTEFNALYKHIMRINMMGFAGVYISQLNTSLRESLAIFNACMAETRIAIARFEIDNCFEPGVIAQKFHFMAIIEAYTALCQELGEWVPNAPPYSAQFNALYAQYQTQGTAKMHVFSDLKTQCSRAHDFLTQHENMYTLLHDLPRSELDKLLTLLQAASDLGVSVSDYRAEVADAIQRTSAGRSSKILPLPYPAHPGLDAFLARLAEMCEQRYHYYQQRNALVKQHAQQCADANKQSQIHAQRQQQSIRARRHQKLRNDHALMVLRQIKAKLLKKANETQCGWGMLYTDAHGRERFNSRYSGLQRLWNIVNNGITVANAFDELCKVQVLLQSKYENRSKTRPDAIHKYYGELLTDIADVKSVKLPEAVNDATVIRTDAAPADSAANTSAAVAAAAAPAQVTTTTRPVTTTTATTTTTNVVQPSLQAAAVTTTTTSAPLPSSSASTDAPALMQSQYLLLSARARMAAVATGQMQAEVSNSFTKPDAWSKQHLLGSAPLKQAVKTRDDELMTARSKLRLIAIAGNEDQVARCYKSVANLLVLLESILNTVSLREVDELMRSVNNLVGIVGKAGNSWGTKFVSGSKEAHNALRLLSLQLDNGLRELLTEVSKNIQHVNEAPWERTHALVHAGFTHASVHQARQTMVASARRCARALHVQERVIDAVRARYLRLFKEGIHYQAHDVVTPVCHFSIFAGQRLAAIEYGNNNTDTPPEWSKAQLSQSFHEHVVALRALRMQLCQQYLSAQANQILASRPPQKINAQTPVLLQECQRMINIIHTADVLLKSVNSGGFAITRAVNGHRLGKQLQTLVNDSNYQDALQAAAAAINAFVRDALVALDVLLATVMRVCADIERDCLVRPGALAHKAQLDQLRDLYLALSTRYNVPAPRTIQAGGTAGGAAAAATAQDVGEAGAASAGAECGTAARADAAAAVVTTTTTTTTTTTPRAGC